MRIPKVCSLKSELNNKGTIISCYIIIRTPTNNL